MSYLNDYSFGVERFDDILPELFPLWQEHHLELVGKDVKLKPNVQHYYQLENAKHLVIFTLRDNNLRLVGYSFFLVSRNLHRTQQIRADNDLFFITKRHRKGMLAQKFIKFCDKKLLELKVTHVIMRTKRKQSFGILLDRCGYQTEEICYLKRLQ